MKRIPKNIQLMVLLVLVAASIGFVEHRRLSRPCTGINITLEGLDQNYFLDEQDVMQLVTRNGARVVMGAELGALDLKDMEQQLKENKYIKKARIYYDLEGQLHVSVRLRQMVARILQNAAPDAYIAEDGSLVPVSDKYASRVMLVTGPFVSQLIEKGVDHAACYAHWQLIKYINQHDFWRAQIAQLDIDRNGKVVMYPQVTRQRIELGHPQDLEDKFQRLMLFYTDILPAKGWNSYERVNVEFNKQIVCE